MASKDKKPTQKHEENKFWAYFSRLFEKYDIRNEQAFISFIKWFIFIVLVVAEVIIILRQVAKFPDVKAVQTFVYLILIEGVLTLSVFLNLFLLKNSRVRLFLFILDSLCAFCFIFFAEGTSTNILYILVLTEFYVNTTHKRSMLTVVIASALYITSFVLYNVLNTSANVSVLNLIAKSFSTVVALLVHFVLMQIALAFYRQYLKLNQALSKLDESNRQLEQSYERVAEVTALKERQRIAKDIHDTAGHSITTVIMQTELAKLIVEENPKEAKQKITAANLQAKHALKELRDSVHLLSGNETSLSLKATLEDILRQSSYGTNITIRSAIEDITLKEDKFRFIVNSLKEGISNGVRHGNATAFWFELKKDGNDLRFLLFDNGTGVAKGGIQEGFGLTSMREKANSFSGKVSFSWEEGEGFELHITLPLDKEKEGDEEN